MEKLLVILLELHVLFQCSFSLLHRLPQETMNLTQMIEYNGYPAESHQVTTEDGYILTLGRIPYNRTIAKGTDYRGAYFLQHGLLCSSDDWVITGPNSLPFLLAQQGYDIWLGNTRGGTYSMKHVTLDPKDKEFWDWTFDEIAKYDVPAGVNYATEVSNVTGLYYVGHSQGTMTAFIQFQRPEIKKKIKYFIAFSPIGRLNHIGGIFYLFSKMPVKLVVDAFDIAMNGRFLRPTKLITFLGDTLCVSPLKEICENVVFMICGYNTKNFNQTLLPAFIAHVPVSTSTKNILHFGMNAQSKLFNKFDYGTWGNIWHYGQINPPEYTFDNFTTPSAFFYGTNDVLANRTDVLNLKKQIDSINSSVIQYSRELKDYEHLDFLWGERTPWDLYQQIVNFSITGNWD